MERLVDTAMDKLYRHSYCYIDIAHFDELFEMIKEHEYYNKYEIKTESHGGKRLVMMRIELVGKPVYSY